MYVIRRLTLRKANPDPGEKPIRASKTLKKLRSGRCARVCGMGHYLPFYIRYAAHFRFDVIWLDLEHRAMSQREVQSILAMCQQHDIDCMVRTPTQGRTRLYRFLEDGATGFMIPFVSNADIARHIVEAVKFPPQGNRGLDGAGLDADFGIEAWKPDSTYAKDANDQTFVVGQISTVTAGEDVEMTGMLCGFSTGGRMQQKFFWVHGERVRPFANGAPIGVLYDPQNPDVSSIVFR